LINDLLSSAKETIIERFSSPLLGSFIIAWGLWNYKFLVILFSAASITQTFQLIESISFPNAATVWLQGIILPLLSALAYVFVYPFPAKFIYTFRLKRQREVNEVRRLIEEETLLTLEQSRAIRAELASLQHKNQENIDKLNAEISRLKSELDIAQKEQLNTAEISTAEKPDGAIEISQLELLRQIANSKIKAFETTLIKSSVTSKTKTEFDLGELQRKELVSREYDHGINSQGYIYDLTHEGRRVLLDN
jgi:hypothetical protein